MRYVIIDLGNGNENELFGKDLVLTNAPEVIIESVSDEIKTKSYKGFPAEDVFFKEIRDFGYVIKYIKPLDDLEKYSVSMDEN